MIAPSENKKIDLEKLPEEKLVRDLETGKKLLPIPKQMILGATAIIIVGIISGYLLSSSFKGQPATSTAPGGKVGEGKVVGSTDTKTFPDSAEGELTTGSINGEGTHKLIRPGGESQTVYLTSSVLDLNQFVGKKVKVWGQTFAAKRAGWLMDVGRVEVL